MEDSNSQARKLLPELTHPTIGSEWRNIKTGDIYTVKYVTYFEEDLDVLVHYVRRMGDHEYGWSRRRQIFYNKFDPI